MLLHRKAVVILLGLLAALAAGAVGVQSFTRTIRSHGKAFAVTGVVVDLRDPQVTMKVGLAWGHVGRTESLEGIAKRYGAVAAINGSFFNAYTREALKNPDMSLISEGQLLFKSDLGALLGFTADNTPHLDIVRHRLLGNITRPTGAPLSWYSYWLNRQPTATPCVTLFTRHWGESVTLPGQKVVVEQGRVIAIRQDAATVPEGGFVLHFRGEARLLARFHVGDTLTFSPEMTVKSGAVDAWGRVREAVGAGPRVLVRGTPVFDPRSEGFSDPKILQRIGARSAAGFTADGKLYLITCGAARVDDLGHLLKALGCTDGLNLDGGASSGLWHRGTYLTTPGRQISNALLVLEK